MINDLDRAELSPTTSRSRRWLLWMGGVGMVCSLALFAFDTIRARGEPTGPATELVGCLRDASVSRLLSDETLGFQSQAQAAVDRLGSEEWGRLMALHAQAQQAGDAALQERLASCESQKAQIAEAGRAEFSALSEAEKWSIWVGADKSDWLYTTALSTLAEEDRVRLPASFTFLTDDAAKDDLAVAMGGELLDEASQALLAQVKAKPALASDSFYAGVVDAARSKGRRAFGRIEKQLLAAMDDAERSCTPRPPGSGPLDKEQAHRRSLGLASLDAGAKAELAECETLQGPDAETAQREFAQKDGLSSLSDEQQSELQQHPESELVASRARFVATQGERLYAEALQGAFDGCTCTPELDRRHGLARRSLLRSQVAQVRIRCSERACGKHLPDTIDVYFHEGDWVLAVPDDEDSIHAASAGGSL